MRRFGAILEEESFQEKHGRLFILAKQGNFREKFPRVD